jgi:hypothetical protein
VSKEFLKGVVQAFLASEEPEVLCLRGKWGTGKTYAWKEWFREATADEKLALKRYAYCSLFGLNSLGDLKASIFESTVVVDKKKVVPVASIDTLKESWRWMEGWARKGAWSAANLVSMIPHSGKIGETSSRLQFLFVRNQLICIDDLERKGAGLTVSDVLGLIAFLREERACKIILILNDEALEELEKEEFEKYLEKVIDVSAVYQPTSEECVAIGIGEDSKVNELVSKYATLLEITNIRVIKRIKKLALEVAGLLENKDPRLLDEAIKTLTVLGWIQFMPGDAPPVDFVKQRSSLRTSAETGKTGRTDKERQWNEALAKVDMGDLTEFDRTIQKGVKDGYFNEDLVTGFADLMARQLEKSDIEHALSQAWDLFKWPLRPNEAEVMDAFTKAVKAGANRISPTNLDSVIRMMRDLERNAEANALIKYVFENRTNEKRYFNLRPSSPTDIVRDPDLRKAFEERVATFDDSRALTEVLSKGTLFGWDADNTARLRKATVAELKEGLVELGGRDAEEVISGVLPGTEVADNGETVGNNLREALKQLAAESKINAVRLRPYLAEPKREE